MITYSTSTHDCDFVEGDLRVALNVKTPDRVLAVHFEPVAVDDESRDTRDADGGGEGNVCGEVDGVAGHESGDELRLGRHRRGRTPPHHPKCSFAFYQWHDATI